MRSGTLGPDEVRATLDRRPAQRGDQRRAALLAALDALLRERDADGGLDAVTVADISGRAGVTRSAFYFYFESKQVAVAALVDEVYAETFASAVRLSEDAGPEAGIEGAIRGLFVSRERQQHVFRAMLEARSTSAAVRELWERDKESFVPAVADLVTSERAAGHAPPGPDAAVLASVLLDLNDRMLERLTRGGSDREELIAAVVAVWTRTIYGRTDR